MSLGREAVWPGAARADPQLLAEDLHSLMRDRGPMPLGVATGGLPVNEGQSEEQED